MRKPKNRKERVDFLIKKMGFDYATCTIKMTDREVKGFVDLIYDKLVNELDYEMQERKPITCLRCGDIIEIEHNHYCSCGMNEAVLNEDELERD